jgi:hypothetical protein
MLFKRLTVFVSASSGAKACCPVAADLKSGGGIVGGRASRGEAAVQEKGFRLTRRVLWF